MRRISRQEDPFLKTCVPICDTYSWAPGTGVYDFIDLDVDR